MGFRPGLFHLRKTSYGIHAASALTTTFATEAAGTEVGRCVRISATGMDALLSLQLLKRRLNVQINLQY